MPACGVLAGGLSVAAPQADDERYRDGMVLWEAPEAAKVPFLVKFNVNTQLRYLNTQDSDATYTDHAGRHIAPHVAAARDLRAGLVERDALVVPAPGEERLDAAVGDLTREHAVLGDRVGDERELGGVVERALQHAAAQQLKGVLDYVTDELVSIDFNHSPFSSSFDATQTQVVDGKLYLNYDASVQRNWEKDIPGHISSANRNWPQVLAK